jgi:UDP-glucose 4-epimerase
MSDELRSHYQGKQVLITGGLGFIGSNLAIRLVHLGAKVLIVDSLIPAYGGNLFNIEPIRDQVIVNIADVRDRYSMDYLVQGQDYLFNLAGTLSHVDSMKDPFTDLQINCVSQLSLLEACRYNNPEIKILFSGTRSQYGRAQYLPVDEKHPMVPVDVNGINNIAGEAYHLLYNNVYGLRACSLRLANTYGPRHQMRHHRQGIINWFVRQIIDQETVCLYGDGRQVRDTNYVNDVVDAMLLAMVRDETNGQVYNLGGHPVSLAELVEMMVDVWGEGKCELVDFPKESKAVEVGDYIADTSKAQRELGWCPTIDLREGLRQTFNYYATCRDKYW